MTKVLVVDDTKLLLDLMACELELEGFSVLAATSGEEALKSVRRHSPAIVVTDIWMPEISGISLIVDLKRSYPGLPVIAMSAYGDADEQRLRTVVTQIGADDFVRKPMPSGALGRCIRRALTRGASERAR